jgi:predicted flap endonuclease-1-like 5' DNA nuclease
MANMTSIDKIRGITPELSSKLKEQKISNTEQLLAAGGTPAGRKSLAQLVGADTKELLELLNRADLDRINGIGEAYANLLEEAGVDTVKELSKRVPANLYNRITEINAEKNITMRPPTMQQVETWVTEAKTLPAILEY